MPLIRNRKKCDLEMGVHSLRQRVLIVVPLVLRSGVSLNCTLQMQGFPLRRGHALGLPGDAQVPHRVANNSWKTPRDPGMLFENNKAGRTTSRSSGDIWPAGLKRHDCRVSCPPFRGLTASRPESAKATGWVYKEAAVLCDRSCTLSSDVWNEP